MRQTPLVILIQDWNVVGRRTFNLLLHYCLSSITSFFHTSSNSRLVIVLGALSPLNMVMLVLCFVSDIKVNNDYNNDSKVQWYNTIVLLTNSPAKLAIWLFLSEVEISVVIWRWNKRSLNRPQVFSKWHRVSRGEHSFECFYQLNVLSVYSFATYTSVWVYQNCCKTFWSVHVQV